jgi:predicted ATPase with chaperone activity
MNVCTIRKRCEFGFSEVKGQYHVRRAVEVAAAGGHNLLMVGPVYSRGNLSFAIHVNT